MLHNRVRQGGYNILNTSGLDNEREYASDNDEVPNETLFNPVSGINIPARILNGEEGFYAPTPQNSFDPRNPSIINPTILERRGIIGPNGSHLTRQEAVRNIDYYLNREEDELPGTSGWSPNILGLPGFSISSLTISEGTPTHSRSATPLRRKSDATTIETNSTEDACDRSLTEACTSSVGSNGRRVSFMAEEEFLGYGPEISDLGGVATLGSETPLNLPE